MGKTGTLTCIVTGKPRRATEEEVVRQEAAAWLIERGYERDALGVEVRLRAGSLMLRGDIVVFDPPDRDPEHAYIIVECKKASVSSAAFAEARAQLRSYLEVTPNVHYGVLYAGGGRIEVFRKLRVERAGVRTLWKVVPVDRLPRASDPAPERFTVRHPPVMQDSLGNELDLDEDLRAALELDDEPGIEVGEGEDAPLLRIPRPPLVEPGDSSPLDAPLLRQPRPLVSFDVAAALDWRALAAKLAPAAQSGGQQRVIVNDHVKVPAGGRIPRRFRLDRDALVEIRVEGSARKTYDVSVWADTEAPEQLLHLRARSNRGDYSRRATLAAGPWSVAIDNDERTSVSVKIVVTIDPETSPR